MPQTGATSTVTWSVDFLASVKITPLTGGTSRVVAAPGDGDVAVVGPLVVGRVDGQPLARPGARTGQPDRDPGVRGVGADDPLLARRRLGREVAADVARGQPVRAQAGERQVREVLADPGPLAEDLVDRRGDRRGGRVVVKSAWIRCIRSVTASPIGRPGSSDAAAYAVRLGGLVDRRGRQREVGGPPGARQRRGRAAAGPAPRAARGPPRRTTAALTSTSLRPAITSPVCGSVTWK